MISSHSNRSAKYRGIPEGAGLVLAVVMALGGQLRAQDDPIDYTSPFGSDGLNQPGLSPREYDERALQEIWSSVGTAQREMGKPIPATMDPHVIQIFREARLLFTLAELRAFISHKHPSYATQEQRDFVARADPILRSLDVRYTSPTGAQIMVDRCVQLGPDRVMKALRPVLSGGLQAKQ